MSARVPASGRTSQRLRELLNGLGDEEVGSQVIRFGIRKIIEEVLEAELRDAVGRGYDERSAEPGRGYHNGTRIGRLKTVEGLVEYGVPQVADRDEPFHSKVREQLSHRGRHFATRRRDSTTKLTEIPRIRKRRVANRSHG